MKTWFSNRPIQTKLILNNFTVILSALIPILGIMFGYEYYAVHRATLQEVQVQAAIISDSTAAAMAFGDAKVASESLASLRASPDILRATLILPNGAILAKYSRAKEPQMSDRKIDVWASYKIDKNIFLNQEYVGKLMLEGSLSSFYNRMLIYLGIVALVSSLGLALAMWLASILQKLITEPLSHLTALTERVATDEDYPVQLMTERADEIGGLSRAFGDMISNVQERITLITRESEQLFSTLAENTPDIIVRYDLNYQRVFVNKEYIKNTGFLLKQILNKPLHTAWLASNITAEKYQDHLRVVTETGTSKQILLEWEDHNGKMVSYDMYVVAERNAKGLIIGVLAFGRNISALKEIERNLDESQALILEWTSIRERTIEKERKRIAREIHDELGQLLTLLRLKIQMLPHKLSGSEQLSERISEAVTIVDTSIKSVRSIASSLRPAVLDAGIVPALEWLIDDFKRHTSITCKLFANQENAPSNDHVIIELFRIAQESLTNVARHAKATEVVISLEKNLNPPQFVLEIRDNGKGFNPSSNKGKKSLGLVGMHERVRILSGELSITSTIGQGTLIRICVPNNETVKEK